MQNRPDPNWAHAYMAAVWNSNYGSAPSLLDVHSQLNTQMKYSDRAQVFAWYDYLKRELPDVFLLTERCELPDQFRWHAVFSARPTLGRARVSRRTRLTSCRSGIRSTMRRTFKEQAATATTLPTPRTTRRAFRFLGLPARGSSALRTPTRRAFSRTLGTWRGSDGVDNGGVAGLIDDYMEGLIDPSTGNSDPLVPPPGGSNTRGVPPQSTWIHVSQVISGHLANHTHDTARSEMLYAILVEGIRAVGLGLQPR